MSHAKGGVMDSKRKRLFLGLALAATLTAGLASAASGASFPNGPARGSEYPVQVIATSTQPKQPKAGKPFTALIGIVNEETGLPVESGEVACPARVGNRGVRMVDKAFVDGTGIAGCTWKIPALAGGKRMVAKVEVYSDEGTVRSRFFRVVRR